MRIFLQFGVFYFQLLVGVFELAIAAVILRHFLRRSQQKHLLFMGVYFVCMGIGHVAGFLGGMFNSQGWVSLGETTVSLFPIMTVIGSAFYAYAFIRLYSSRRRLSLYVVATLAGIVALLLVSTGITESLAFLLPINTISEFPRTYWYWATVNILAATAAVVACAHGRKNRQPDAGEPDRMLFVGTLLTLLAGLVTLFFIRISAQNFAAVVYALFLIGAVFKYLGAAAKNHPDPQYARKPLYVITSTLSSRVLAYSAVFYVAFTFVLLSSLTQYLMGHVMEENELRMRQNIEFATQFDQKQQERLASVASLIGTNGQALLAVTGDAAAQKNVIESVKASKNALKIQLVGLDGRLIASSNGETVGEFVKSDVLTKAMSGGEPVSAIEMSDGVSVWLVLGASPILDSSGQLMGGVVISRPYVNVALPNCGVGSGLSVSGCGIISADGQMVASNGEDLSVADMFRIKSVLADPLFTGKFSFGPYYSVFAKNDSIGLGDQSGFVYAFITNRDMDRSVSRILSVIVAVSVLMFLVVSVILIYGVSVLMRPISQLREAAERMARGDYDYRIAHDSSDEIGHLATAFNVMSATISDRTRSLKERMREQEDFLVHTAHEMRTPLNIFRWSLEMLRFGDAGKLNDEQMELVEQMHQTNERMRKLVSEMLDVAKLERGTIQLKRGTVQVEDVADEVAGNFAVRLREKGVNFYWHRPDRALPEVQADRDKLTQIMMNLVSNAAKFTESGGQISLAVTESGTSGPSGHVGSFIAVSVADNGLGIPAKDQPSIFGRFFRAGNAVSREIDGTGLGLFLAKQYVEMHGGELWFESKEGAGSTFYFTIPTSANPKSAIETPS